MRADPKRIATIKAVYRRGGTLTEAAREAGMLKQNAWRLARALGLTGRRSTTNRRARELRDYWLSVDPSVKSA